MIFIIPSRYALVIPCHILYEGPNLYLFLIVISQFITVVSLSLILISVLNSNTSRFVCFAEPTHIDDVINLWVYLKVVSV